MFAPTASPNAPSAAAANLIFMAVMPVHSPPETGYPGHNISRSMHGRTVFASIEGLVIGAGSRGSVNSVRGAARLLADALAWFKAAGYVR